jgi:hypothetical protein
VKFDAEIDPGAKIACGNFVYSDTPFQSCFCFVCSGYLKSKKCPQNITSNISKGISPINQNISLGSHHIYRPMNAFLLTFHTYGYNHHPVGRISLSRQNIPVGVNDNYSSLSYAVYFENVK